MLLTSFRNLIQHTKKGKKDLLIINVVRKRSVVTRLFNFIIFFFSGNNEMANGLSSRCTKSIDTLFLKDRAPLESRKELKKRNSRMIF